MEDLVATLDVEDSVATVDVVGLVAAAAAGVVAVGIEVEGEEAEARGQVVLHTLKARRLLLTDCTLSFVNIRQKSVCVHLVLWILHFH